MNMLMEQIHKRTDKDHGHPDVDTLLTIMDIVASCIKATQPGIEAAEQKVKFLDLLEGLVTQKGEITVKHLVGMNCVSSSLDWMVGHGSF